MTLADITAWAAGWDTLILLLALAALIVRVRWLSRKSRKRAPTDISRPTIPADRAEALLHDVLDEREYQQLKRHGYFDVRSPTEAYRVYRIPAYAGLVRVYEHGVATHELCVQPVEPLPSADVAAMHKLMIQGNEQEYLLRARRHPPLQPNQRYRP